MAAGTYPIYVHYNGSTNNEPTSGALEIAGTLTITPRSSTTAISSATSNPTTFGQPVALVATVGSSSGTPTGTVTFYDGATTLGTATLAAGSASLSVSTLAVGVHGTISASYAGDGNYASSSSGSLSRTVNKADQTISLTAPATQTFGGGTVALTATASSGLTVSYVSNSASVCTVSGSTVTLVGAGTCSITASQGGNTNYNAAPDVTRTFTIDPATQVISFTAPGPQTFVPAGTIALTATGGASGNPVTFTSSTASVCTVSGSTVTMIAAGNCTITANQVGNANFTAAPAVAQTFAIAPGTTSTTLMSSLSQTLVGQPVTFSATILPAAATGTVTFFDGASPLGTSPVSAGSASWNSSLLAAGAHSIRAVYNGSANFASSSSVQLSHSVIANGAIVFRVTSEGDGPFTFSSSTGSLAMTLATSGGTAQSSPVPLNPGTYGVTVTPPDGFGITAISCSDGDSTGNVSAKSASIVLASAESVTCSFTATNSRKKAVEVISRFMGQRNDLLLSTGPDPNRQIDRLIEASGGNASGGGSAGFSGGSKPLGGGTGPSRLGNTGDGSFNSSFAAPALAAAQRGPSIGPRSFDDRLDALGHAPRRPRNEQAGLSPIGVTGNTEGASRFSFSTSLSQMTRFNSDVAARKAIDAESANGSGPMALGAGKLPVAKRAVSPLDIWAEGHFLSFADNRNNADSDGHFGVFYVGADYIVKPWLLVGLLAQYDTMHQRSTTQAFDIKGSGWMAGPYATVRLSENIFLQGRLAAGRSTNEVSPFLTYIDTFSTKRWLVTTALVGRWQVGNWQIQPSASLSYIEDVSEAYTDSLGVGIPGLKASLGQFKAGPQFSYRHVLADGTLLEPRFGAELIWNFTASNKVADFGGTLSGPEELRGRVELGLRTQFTNGVGLDLSGSYDGIGSDTFHALGAKATVRVPFN